MWARACCISLHPVLFKWQCPYDLGAANVIKRLLFVNEICPLGMWRASNYDTYCLFEATLATSPRLKWNLFTVLPQQCRNGKPGVVRGSDTWPTRIRSGLLRGLLCGWHPEGMHAVRFCRCLHLLYVLVCLFLRQTFLVHARDIRHGNVCLPTVTWTLFDFFFIISSPSSHL